MSPHVTRIEGKLWVHFRGRIYAMPARKKEATSATVPEDEAELIAPFSCKILKVLAKDGQKVAKGDPVVTVEAMKMEYTYASPRDGTIAKVLVTPGEIVTEGKRFVDWSAP